MTVKGSLNEGKKKGGGTKEKETPSLKEYEEMVEAISSLRHGRFSGATAYLSLNKGQKVVMGGKSLHPICHSL